MGVFTRIMEPYSQNFIFFVIKNGPDKFACLFLASLSSLCNVTLQLIVLIHNQPGIKIYRNKAPGCVFTTLHFPDNFQIGPICESACPLQAFPA
jgi:hypothetical protein